MWILTAWALSSGFEPAPMQVFQKEMPFALTYVYDLGATLQL